MELLESLRTLYKKQWRSNRTFVTTFTEKKVICSLNQMHRLKFLLDWTDFLCCSSQRIWSTIKVDLLFAILANLNDGALPEAINHTSITLIPKLKQPNTPKDYRTISFCNTILKLITKYISNRIKPIILHLIRPISFCPGPPDFHALNHNNYPREASFDLKLDMSIAFVRVEW